MVPSMDKTERRRGGGRVALILGVVLLVLCAGGGVLTGLAHQLTLGLAAGAVGFLVFGLTGVIVAYHQPRNLAAPHAQPAQRGGAPS